jgi:hypothetical protein
MIRVDRDVEWCLSFLVSTRGICPALEQRLH